MHIKNLTLSRVLITALFLATIAPHLHADVFPNGTMVAGDFNLDGRPDLAVVNYNSPNVSVFLRSSNGTFLPALNSAARPNPSSLAIGDLNGDGIPDLVVKNYNDLSALLGNGNGTFQTPGVINLPSGQSFYHGGYAETAIPALADFNHDGHLDIAITGVKNNGDYLLNVLLGTGNGTFHTGSTRSIAPLSGPWEALIAGDFTGDGNLDVLTGVSFSGFDLGVRLRLFPGSGDGNLLPTIITKNWYGDLPPVLAAADFNGDGGLDFAIASRVLTVMLNVDGTNFTPLPVDTGGAQVYDLAVGDFTGDAKPDILASTDFNICGLVGNGDGTFQRRDFPMPSDGFAVALADFNSDGNLDAAVAAPGPSVSVVLNLNPAPRMEATRFEAGTFFGRVVGQTGQKQVIEASSDLVNWVVVATNQAGAATFDFSHTTSWSQGFYRARVIP